MITNFYNKFRFTGQKNQSSSTKDKTDDCIKQVKIEKSDEVPKSLDLNNEVSIYGYSRQKVRELYRYFGLGEKGCLGRGSKKYYNKQLNNVMKKLSDGSVNSSNLEMVLDLVKNNVLAPEVLRPIYENGQISRNAAKDLDKLYEAYINNQDILRAFVPEFENDDDALKCIEAGGVCQIKGKPNISTKLPTGEMKELFITPETYMRLFPPVERFIVSQSGAGDCYLLSVFDAINQNPNTRYKLLELFRENLDGTIDVAIGGFENKEGQIVKKNDLATIVENFEDVAYDDYCEDELSYTTDAVRAFEVLIDYTFRQEFEQQFEIEEKESKKLRYDTYCTLKRCLETNKIPMPPTLVNIVKTNPNLKAQYEEAYKNEIKNLNIKDDEIYFWGTIYTKEEIELFLDLIHSGTEMFTLTASQFCTAKGCRDIIKNNKEFTYKQITDKLSELKNCKNNDAIRYLKLRLERAKDYLERKGKNEKYKFDGCLPKEAYYRLFETTDDPNDSARYFYSDGGSEASIFSRLGFHNIEMQEISEAEELLLSDEAKKYIFTCGTNEDILDNNFPIYKQHAYSLEPVDVDGERKFIVRNPHNSMLEATFNYEEFCKYFTQITFAKIDGDI